MSPLTGADPTRIPQRRRPGRTWENSDWAAGKKLAKFVRGYAKASGITLGTIGRDNERGSFYATITSPLSRWEQGGAAHYSTVDRVCIELGIHISEVPDEVWL